LPILQPAARSHHTQPHPSQTGPHGQLVCGQHRFVELTLQWGDNVVGRKVSAGNKHRVCVWIVTCQNELCHGSVIDPPDPTAEAQVFRAGHQHTQLAEEGYKMISQACVVGSDNRNRRYLKLSNSFSQGSRGCDRVWSSGSHDRLAQFDFTAYAVNKTTGGT